MSDFFKTLLSQLKDIWTRFNPTQKIILSSVFILTFAGLIIAVSLSSFEGGDSDQSTLFSNLGTEEAAEITAFLKEQKYNYELENNGRAILVSKNKIHEIRMDLARNGLPGKSGKGYELFDEMQLGVTDFVQNLNYRRAIEAELVRSIETLREVDRARLHINIPKETIFMDEKKEAQASVILKLKAGGELNRKQIRGVQHLVSSAITDLKARQVTILDNHGNMLTQGFADDAVAEHTDHNMSLTRSVEKHLEQKIMHILEGVLGPNKARVQVSAELDFDQIRKDIETYDPKKKVVRSEQRDDGTTRNSPAVGDETKEGSITNYEIDRSVAHIIDSPGETKRISVSVAVDGIYEEGEDGKLKYKARGEEQIATITELVKKAVGYDVNRSDEVFVANVQFDKSFLNQEREALSDMEKQDFYKQMAHWGLIAVILLAAFFAVRRIIRDVASAMNPPLPRYAGIDLEVEDEDEPENLKRQNELLDRMEAATAENPANVAELIRAWLHTDATAS